MIIHRNSRLELAAVRSVVELHNVFWIFVFNVIEGTNDDTEKKAAVINYFIYDS